VKYKFAAMEDLILAVSTPCDLDLELYLLWVAGNTEDDAFRVKLDSFRKSDINYRLEFRGPNQHQNEQSEFVKLEVHDQFRTFELIEHYLAHPPLLKGQIMVIVRPDYQSFLLDTYWSVDDSFVREVLNKRLARSRKDLEDAANSTDLSLRSVTRQYDNIKRVYNAYEDPNNTVENNIYTFMTKNYLLSPQLSRRYACVLFLLVQKFNLTAKKRLLNVECEKYV